MVNYLALIHTPEQKVTLATTTFKTKKEKKKKKKAKEEKKKKKRVSCNCTLTVVIGEASQQTVNAATSSTGLKSTMNVDHEVKLLVEEIKKLGTKNADGQYSVKFGKLFVESADIFEALVGTLKAAKKKRMVSFDGELLLQGVHDNVDVVLLQE